MNDARTRDKVVADHVALALRHSELTRESFADQVMQLYCSRTPLHLRHIPFHAHTRGADPYAVIRANAQLVFRQLDGVVRLAVELEEAVVLALPAPYQGACLRELAARYGLLAAEQPGDVPAAQLAQLGDLVREFGEALQAVAGTLSDGRLDHADALASESAVRELDDLIATATTLRAAHAAVVNRTNVTHLAAAGGSRL